MTMGVIWAMTLGVTWAMVMVVGQTGGEGQARRDLGGGRHGVRVAGDMHGDPITGQPPHESLTRSLGDQGIQPPLEEGVILAMKLMEGQLRGRVEALDLHRGPPFPRLVDEEAPGLARMAGDGAEILAGDRDAHGLTLIDMAGLLYIYI